MGDWVLVVGIGFIFINAVREAIRKDRANHLNLGRIVHLERVLEAHDIYPEDYVFLKGGFVGGFRRLDSPDLEHLKITGQLLWRSTAQVVVLETLLKVHGIDPGEPLTESAYAELADEFKEERRATIEANLGFHNRNQDNPAAPESSES